MGGVISIILSGISGRMQYRGVDDFPQLKISLDKVFKYVSSVEVIAQTDDSTTLKIYIREFSGETSDFEISFEESDSYLLVSENVVRRYRGLKDLNFSIVKTGVIVSIGRGDSRRFELFYPFSGR